VHIIDAHFKSVKRSQANQGGNMYGDGFRFGLGSFLKIYFVCYREIPVWNEPHAVAPFWRFFYDFEESVTLETDNGRITCDPEHFYIIPGFTRLSCSSQKLFRRFYIHFGLGERVLENNNVYVLPAASHELDLIREFAGAGEKLHNTRQTILYAQAILASTLLRLPPEISESSRLTDPRIENAVKYINEHCHAPQNNTFLANLSGMSRDGFLRLFEQETGRSPQFYWRKKRIEKACELLISTSLSIDEIAEKTGFADRYHFSRVFSNFLKNSPAKFRKNN